MTTGQEMTKEIWLGSLDSYDFHRRGGYKRKADIVLIKFSQRGRMEIKRFKKYMHTCLVISGNQVPIPFHICFCITGITQMS